MTTINTDGASAIQARIPVRLLDLYGAPVEAVVTSVKVERLPASGGPSCIIRLEVDAAAANSIVRKGLFHLFHQTLQFKFEEGTPVTIEAALRPNLAKQLFEQRIDAAGVIEALAAQSVSPAEGRESQAENPFQLGYTECWMALQLLQQTISGEQSPLGGTLTEGFTTDWAPLLEQLTLPDTGNNTGDRTEPFTQSDANSAENDGQPPQRINTFVERQIAAHRLKYEVLDEQLIRIRFSSERGSWVSLLRMEQEQGACFMYSIFPEEVPEPQRPSVALQLMRENYDLIFGNFEMDEDDGELRYRSPLIFGNEWNPQIFAQQLGQHLDAVEQFMPIIYQMIHDGRRV